ncbi:hypothetical protein N7450_011739 [Penicillium hetheringtonii]|uniref:Uncharacterized protein n=1 Tax=Penicillium hetheringtonii TaxID=911720 RepID=A0AAD6GM57_9EURO|nr:hypothetical protein N7450_011739 [Penicillium hetheringtonii]
MQSRCNCSRLRQLLPVASPRLLTNISRVGVMPPTRILLMDSYRSDSAADFVPARMPRAAATGKDQKSTLLDVPRASPFLRDCQSCSDKTSRAVNFDFLLLLRDILRYILLDHIKMIVC